MLPLFGPFVVVQAVSVAEQTATLLKIKNQSHAPDNFGRGFFVVP
jgi:hypothetical protein